MNDFMMNSDLGSDVSAYIGIELLYILQKYTPGPLNTVTLYTSTVKVSNGKGNTSALRSTQK
jgi:hypothetical protein